MEKLLSPPLPSIFNDVSNWPHSFSTVALNICSNLVNEEGGILHSDEQLVLRMLLTSPVEFIARGTKTEIFTQFCNSLETVFSASTAYAYGHDLIAIVGEVVTAQLTDVYSDLRNKMIVLIFSGITSKHRVFRKQCQTIWNTVAKSAARSKGPSISLSASSPLENKEVLRDQILIPLTHDIWDALFAEKMEISEAVERAVQVSVQAAAISQASYALNVLFTPLITRIWVEKETDKSFLPFMDFDFVGPNQMFQLSQVKAITDRNNSLKLSQIKKYLLIANFISQFLLVEFKNGALAADQVFTNWSDLVLELLILYFVTTNQFKSKNDKASVEPIWSSSRSSVVHLVDEYLIPFLKFSAGTELLEKALARAQAEDTVENLLVLKNILQLVNSDLVPKWGHQALQNHQKLSLGVLSSLTVALPLLDDSFFNELVVSTLKTLNTLGASASPSNEDLERCLSLICGLLTSGKATLQRRDLEGVSAFASTLVQPKMLTSLSGSLRCYVACLFQYLLSDSNNSSLPDSSHALWKNMWSYIESALTDDFTDPTTFLIKFHVLNMFKSLVVHGKRDHFIQGNPDTIEVNGQRVVVSVSGSAQDLQAWNQRKDKLLLMVSTKFLSANFIPNCQMTLFSSLAQVVVDCPQDFISAIPDSTDKLYRLLFSSSGSIAGAAHLILERIVSAQVETFKPISNKSLSESQGALNIDFVPVTLRDTLVATPKESDPEGDKLAYLFAFNLFLKYFGTRNSKQKSDLGIFLKQNNLSTNILNMVWSQIDIETEPKSTVALNTDLEDLSAFVFKQAIYKLPSTVRVWWRDLNNRKTSNAVEKYVARNISPGLIADEIRKIAVFNKDPNAISNPQDVVRTSNLTPDESTFTITGWKGSGEVHASYEKDEVTAAIILQLADNHPLRAVTVNSKAKMGINESTWRTWLLGMTTLLLTQDATVLDAALLWQNSLNKHFDGTELCPICYALFHASNYSLPTHPCKTCKTKFHSACLFTWFNNSHKNECPICRSAFS